MATSYTIGPDDAGQRFDRYLRKLLPNATLANVFKLIRKGRARVNDQRAEGARRLAEGDTVRIDLDASLVAKLARRRAAKPPAVAGGIELLYRDDDILAVAKPAGLPVHAGSGVGDHLIARVHARFGAGDARTFRPAPAHRLDRETSGVLLIGRSARGLRGLAGALRDGRIEKRYLALLEQAPEASSGRIDVALERIDSAHGAKARPRASGSEAVTEYRVLEVAGDGSALVEARLVTGRTHQLRAHFAAIGCPLLGDRRYGSRRSLPFGGGFCLHAAELRLAHPVSGERLAIGAPPPERFLRVLHVLGLRAPA